MREPDWTARVTNHDIEARKRIPPAPSDDKAAKLEEIDRLEEAVAKLPIKLRQVVVLHYLEQLTIAEAAESAGVKEGTFKSRLNRALKALRNEIGS